MLIDQHTQFQHTEFQHTLDHMEYQLDHMEFHHGAIDHHSELHTTIMATHIKFDILPIRRSRSVIFDKRF